MISGSARIEDELELSGMRTFALDTVQDFLIKLRIKPRLHEDIEDKHFFTKSCHHQK